MENYNIKISISPRNNYFFQYKDGDDDDFFMCVVRNNKLFLIEDKDEHEETEITLEEFVKMIRDRNENI
jgi:hypothetical protein